MNHRRPVVGVMGGAEVDASVLEMARSLGALVAGRGWVLLNGGRNSGVMAASARGAKEVGGTVIGVLPDLNDAQGSPDLDFAIITGLNDARNLINVLSSDVVIACPGGPGTLSEVMLALKHGKPVILLGLDAGPAVEPYRTGDRLRNAKDPADAVEMAADLLANSSSIKRRPHGPPFDPPG